MTSKLKCPFCQQELHKDPDEYYSCYTDNCSIMSTGGNGASGTESLWRALIQSKQDLEIAKKALKWLGNNHLAENPVRVEQLRRYARNTLEQIEHKEKKNEQTLA